MTKEEFDRIYQEEGIADADTREAAWEARSSLSDLKEETVRESAILCKLFEPYLEKLGRFMEDYTKNQLLKPNVKEFLRFLRHKNN